MLSYPQMVRGVVDLLLEKKARVESEKAFIEIQALDDGGIVIVGEVDGEELVWEFDRDQTVILIRALTLAFVSRQLVKIVQPSTKSAA